MIKSRVLYHMYVLKWMAFIPQMTTAYVSMCALTRYNVVNKYIWLNCAFKSNPHHTSTLSRSLKRLWIFNEITPFCRKSVWYWQNFVCHFNGWTIFNAFGHTIFHKIGVHLEQFAFDWNIRQNFQHHSTTLSSAVFQTDDYFPVFHMNECFNQMWLTFVASILHLSQLKCHKMSNDPNTCVYGVCWSYHNAIVIRCKLSVQCNRV